MPDINLSPYTAESAAIAQRMRMAELLNQQAMQPLEMPQVAGARISPYAGLAKMLQGYTSGMMQRKALEQQAALANRYQTQGQEELSNFQKLYEGTSAVPQKELAGPAPQGAPTGVSATEVSEKGQPVQGGYIQPAQEAVPGDMKKAMAYAISAKTNPLLQNLGYQAMMDIPKMEAAKAERETQRDFLRSQQQERLAETANQNEQNRISRADVARESIEARKENAKLIASLKQSRKDRIEYDSARGGFVNKDTGEFKPALINGEPIGAKEKPLTSGEVNKITDIDTSLGTQKRLKDTFDDKYAGYKLQMQGELANVIGSKFGGDNQSQAEWWASHAANDNIARNALFGASLTAGEQKAWEKTSINPGMSPSMIKNRMAEREALIEAKRDTTVDNLGKAGYDVKGFKNKPDFYNPSVNTPPVSALKEGQTTTFANGQKWTLQSGKPVQVK
jgi:hypothetical protein